MSGRIAVLASGGLDSSVLLAAMARKKREVYPLYVRAGLAWEPQEELVLRRFIHALGEHRIHSVTVLDLPMSDVSRKHWSISGHGVPSYDAPVSSNYIVGRNLGLIAKAAIFCAYHRTGELAIAPLLANPFPDAQPEFFEALAHAIDLGLGLRLKIRTPFVGLGKAEVIRRGRHLPLHLTLSCARPKGTLHCGKCTKCAERIEAFVMAMLPDPTHYASSRRIR